MTNEEMMNEQIKAVAEMFKAQFTKEELEDIEKRFDAKLKELKNLEENKSLEEDE